MSEPKEINILLVEDTEEHALLIQRGLEEGPLKNRLFWVRDGEEAVDFLFNREKYASETDFPKPDIILLDLRLPKLSGSEALEKTRSEARLRNTPVVVLTVSDQPEDILTCCRDGAQSYLLKSVAFAPKTEGVQSILNAIISLV
ncbi:MAG: response regulator [Chloroflexi bacterium]|nr:response regulator [Chloroflexota bacterium]